MAQPNYSKKPKTADQGAQGALLVCQASMVPTSAPDAYQDVHAQTELPADPAIHSGGVNKSNDRMSPMLVETIQTSTAPVTSFAIATKAQPTFSSLLATLSAAVAETERCASVEDNLSLEYSKVKTPRPSVLGGKTPAGKIIQEGRPDVDLPATDWFFRSREEIEKSHVRELADAKSDDERAAVESRTAELLAEFDRQEKGAARAVPKALRTAKRKLNAAHRAWDSAEQAIVAFRPASLAEAAALLEFAGKAGTRGVYFQPDDGDLKTIMRNAAAAIQSAS
jgi:hypothetical protein